MFFACSFVNSFVSVCYLCKFGGYQQQCISSVLFCRQICLAFTCTSSSIKTNVAWFFGCSCCCWSGLKSLYNLIISMNNVLLSSLLFGSEMSITLLSIIILSRLTLILKKTYVEELSLNSIPIDFTPWVRQSLATKLQKAPTQNNVKLQWVL